MALYIVATPIGNLKDISERAVETLKGVDLILCEDTRETKKLLDCYGIESSVLSYHQHSKLNKVDKIIEMLKKGKDLALVSDAGTPCISDPGSKLVEEAIKEDIDIFPIPGPSALIACASISGFPVDRFVFLGFPPAKRKRKKFFEEAVGFEYPVIFYESCHRIIKSLEELKELNKKLEVVVCRELTKKFETVYRGDIEKVIENVKNDEVKGEFAVIIRKP